MHPELSQFAARLRRLMEHLAMPNAYFPFSELALELFALQFQSNAAYRQVCEARGQTPATVRHWSQIPTVPAAAFKDLELTSLAPAERTTVFHSSGTTEQRPSRQFHSAESLAVYEASLWTWFKQNCGLRIADYGLICLTPPTAQVPHSSLVHMFEFIRHTLAQPATVFVGRIDTEGCWTLDVEAALAALSNHPKSEIQNPKLILGTAFSFVHLLDHLVERDLRVELPPGSLVMETGGYKNRSRVLPKSELHALITARLGVPPEQILCEYGMSELSSQAYDSEIHPLSFTRHPRVFRFPPWARAQIISPETGQVVGEGDTGLIRILDLSNVFSVLAVQTEDLGIRRGDGFELIGRAQLAEPRGCSLMNI